MKYRLPLISAAAMIAAGSRAAAQPRAMTFDHAIVNAGVTVGGFQLPPGCQLRAPHESINDYGDARGMTLDRAIRYQTHDGRALTMDSTGAFLVGELERLDQTLHMPLVETSWARDIDLREDVSIADEASSFTLSTFGSAGSLGAGNGIRNGKAWIGKATDQITGVSLDIGKYPQPLTPWAVEVKFTILELESAIRAGRPIDDQKYQGMKLKHDMDVDEQVYVGDSSLGVAGLLNHPGVTNVSNVPNGAGGSPLWKNKTPDEILTDLNDLITSGWRASGYKVMPNKIGLPPEIFGYISTAKIGSAAQVSILKYLLENNVLNSSGKGTLSIVPMKWLVGAGVGGTLGTPGTVDRMIAYTQESKFVRFPKTMLARTPVQYMSIYQMSTYYCKIGVVELVYPETVAYRDGI